MHKKSRGDFLVFDIFFTAESKKVLNKLNKEDSKRIISTLERCRIRPHAHVKKLISSPYFRLRVGDYRVILDIKAGKLLIIVVEIGHRKNIYKS
ncbi:type II toxin-antitoxin system RelE/ParE family toxin [Candidatus Woesearchaeota archaeon]|nr:type II toxin-antitoxin system RelE/ParE family toxin [Candidatus Woesearchaeota archaeon]